MQTRSKTAKPKMTVEEFKQLVSSPEAKENIKKALTKVREDPTVQKKIKEVKQKTEIKINSKLKAAYYKQKELETEQKKAFDMSAIHARRDDTKDDPKWIEQKNIFLGNLHRVANDEKLAATIHQELKTISKMLNQSPTLEDEMFKGLDRNTVYIETESKSSYQRILMVFRQVVPAVRVDEVKQLAKDLKKLMQMSAYKDKSIVDWYSDFRMVLKQTFGKPGKEGKYYKSDHFSEFGEFGDADLKQKTDREAEDRMLNQPKISIAYSRVLNAIKKWYDNKTDIEAEAKLCAVALATGMRDDEIKSERVEVMEVEGKPNHIWTKGIAKQREKEKSEHESVRPVIGLTGEQVVDAIELIRGEDMKKTKLKMSFVEEEFPEPFREKDKRIAEKEAKGESTKGEKVRSLLRSLYAETVYSIKKYNPKDHPLKKLLRDYFGHSLDKSTPLWYMDKFQIVDDVSEGKKTDEKKAVAAADCGGVDVCSRLEYLTKQIQELKSKSETTRTAAYNRKKILTEDELIKKGQDIMKSGKTYTTREFRQKMGIGNDKVKWLMQQLGARKPEKPWLKKGDSKKESKEEESEDEEEDEPVKEAKHEKKESKAQSLMDKLKLNKDDIGVSADGTQVTDARQSSRSSLAQSGSGRKKR